MDTNLNQVRDDLTSARIHAEKWVSEIVLSGDYDGAAASLRLVRMISDTLSTLDSLSQISEKASAIKAPNSNIVSKPHEQPKKATERFHPEDEANKIVPLFFIREDRLIKIGTASSVKSGYYKKSIPMSNVRAVMDLLVAFNKKIGGAPFGAKAFYDYAKEKWSTGKLPEYHVHVTLGALKKVGVLLCQPRAEYTLSSATEDISAWENAIGRLKIREDLYEIAK